MVIQFGARYRSQGLTSDGSLCGMVAIGLVVTFLLRSPALAAEDSRSAWERLPNETVVAVRIPNGAAISRALFQQTKIGTVLSDSKRIAVLKEIILEQDQEPWGKLKSSMSEYGLSAADLTRALAGESGIAVVQTDRDDQEPLFIGLGWCEPGEELGIRLYDALRKAAEDAADQDDEARRLRRVEYEIEGHPVMQITLPIVRHAWESSGLDLPDDFDELSDEEQEEALENAEENFEVEALEKVRYSSLFVCPQQGRLLTAITLNDFEEDVPEDVEEAITKIFSRFLAGEEGGFIARVSTNEGIRSVMAGEGVVALDVLADISLPIKTAIERASSDQGQIVSSLGLDQLGGMALRLSLDNSVFRTGFFFSAPAPRRGVLALLDQPPISPEPPEWIPASVVQYSQFSVDLGRVYVVTKDIVLDIFSDQAEPTFQMIEAQVQGFAQADLTQVLSSLGHAHRVLTFEPKRPANLNGESDQSTEVLSERVAVVWNLQDEAIWSRLLKGIAAFAPLTDGAMKFVEEQGFKGWRLSSDEFEGGLFLGKGFLVLAIGNGVVELALSTLNNPPDGNAALRNSELFRRANEIIELRSGLAFDVLDGNRYAKSSLRMIDSVLRQLEGISALADLDEAGDGGAGLENARGGDASTIKRIRELLPTEQEMENVMGAAASFTLVDDLGMSSRAASELPPPD